MWDFLDCALGGNLVYANGQMPFLQDFFKNPLTVIWQKKKKKSIPNIFFLTFIHVMIITFVLQIISSKLTFLMHTCYLHF